MDKWLRAECRFDGAVIVGEVAYPTRVTLKPNLEAELYLPHAVADMNRLPVSVSGVVKEWIVRLSKFKSRKRLFTPERVSPQLRQLAKVALGAQRCTFICKEQDKEIPDEWGISLYPPKNNNTLYHLIHEGPEFGKPVLPSFVPFDDGCLYFKNRPSWSVSDLEERIDLITGALALFAGVPLTYSLIVGRRNGKVVYMQFNQISNLDEFICPTSYNGHAAVRDKRFKIFSASTVIDEISKAPSDPDFKKTRVIFQYLKLLYTTPFRESTIAFSFQLMEALATYKGMTMYDKKKSVERLEGKICQKCYDVVWQELLPKQVDRSKFDGYFDKAVDVINNHTLRSDNYSFDSTLLWELATLYRNYIFHGNLFENEKKIKDKMATLTENYQRDLPIVMQSIVSIIAANTNALSNVTKSPDFVL